MRVWNILRRRLQYEVGEEYRPHMDTVDGARPRPVENSVENSLEFREESRRVSRLRTVENSIVSQSVQWDCRAPSIVQLGDWKRTVDTSRAGFNLSGRAGGRIATLILYLDEDFEGGATTFPQLDLAIAPKRGTALFFQNVQVPLLSREARAMKSDARATHAGEPVLSGTKHVMTKWFHPLPFKQDLSEPNREQERRLKVPVSD